MGEALLMTREPVLAHVKNGVSCLLLEQDATDRFQ